MNHRTTRRRLLTGGALALAAGLALTGCDSGGDGSGDAAKKPELKVSGAYIPAPAMADMAGGFFTLTNKGAADKLTSASSPLAGSVTLHATRGGTMKEQRSFDVPANGELVFARGGNHIMLEKLKRKPKQGDTVEVTLRFEKADPITVEMPVKAATYNPGTGGDPSAHSGDSTSHEGHSKSHEGHSKTGTGDPQPHTGASKTHGEESRSGGATRSGDPTDRSGHPKTHTENDQHGTAEEPPAEMHASHSSH
ncbi:copper chaperone PCu(A)C [Streptomyces longispororuber]|uniref:copper chaperone PCu(A)C n=1 Tax=Streptomyces longispororuber TaxID=68230 RepID=UPI003F575CB3